MLNYTADDITQRWRYDQELSKFLTGGSSVFQKLISYKSGDNVVFNIEGDSERETILVSATKQFLSRGFEATNIIHIARDASVTETEVHTYFKDTQDIFSEVLRSAASSKRWPTGPDFEELSSSIQPDGFLKIFALEFFSAAQEDEEFLPLLRLLLVESERFPTLARTSSQYIEAPMRNFIADYLRENKFVRFEDPESVAAIFIGTLFYFSTKAKLCEEENGVSAEFMRILDTLVDTLIASCTEP